MRGSLSTTPYTLHPDTGHAMHLGRDANHVAVLIQPLLVQGVRDILLMTAAIVHDVDTQY